MKCSDILLFVTILGGTWQIGRPTCVLESDFGFTLNCGFKKSGLFRVRNLGGVKAHIGLGFSVGDELGFKESLTNSESNKRRSASVSKLTAQLIQAQQAQQEAKKRNMMAQSGNIAPADSRIGVGSVEVVTPLAMGEVSKSKKSSIVVPPFRPIPPADERFSGQKEAPTAVQGTYGNPSDTEIMAVIAVPKKNIQMHAQKKNSNDNFAVRILPTSATSHNEIIPQMNSIASPTNQMFAHNDTFFDENDDMDIQQPVQLPVKPKPSPTTPRYVNKYANSVGKVMNAPKEYYPVGYDKNFDDNFASRVELPETSFYCGDQKHFLLPTSATSHNEIIPQMNSIASPTNQMFAHNDTFFDENDDMDIQQPVQLPVKPKPSPTTPRYINKYANSVGKVMNAPKEYYPVGYDKNFDDNFASRVELPETSFYCGDQKHFPGLYADEDLGCMVFHVCALTDDGLIMKSFLCPESTLFDQTILKCNWWFYVDCKNSKKLYDSNIPISKSYQLMKALTFFSAYKNDNKNKTNDKD
uniref:Uncharacterized protein LOC114330741 n=1 Tax=Diabrotica virgifera virgifera TaxID=50390 RepID=A0A6P7FT19_DIAVI